MEKIIKIGMLSALTGCWNLACLCPELQAVGDWKWNDDKSGGIVLRHEEAIFTTPFRGGESITPPMLLEGSNARILAMVSFPAIEPWMQLNAGGDIRLFHGYLSLPEPVKEALSPVITQTETQMTFHHTLYFHYIVRGIEKSMSQRVIKAPSFWYPGREFPKMQALVQFVPLSDGQIGFAIREHQSAVPESLQDLSNREGFFLRNFPYVLKDKRWFGVQIAKPKDLDNPFAYASLIWGSRGGVHVTVEILCCIDDDVWPEMKVPERYDLRKFVHKVEDLLGRFTDPEYPCYIRPAGRRFRDHEFSLVRSPSTTDVSLLAQPGSPVADEAFSNLISIMEDEDTYWEECERDLLRAAQRFGAPQSRPDGVSQGLVPYGNARVVDISFPSLLEDLKRTCRAKDIPWPEAVPSTIDDIHLPVTLPDLPRVLSFFSSTDHTAFIPEHPNFSKSDIEEAKLEPLWDICVEGPDPLLSCFIQQRDEALPPDIESTFQSPDIWQLVDAECVARPTIREIFLQVVRNPTGLQRILSLLILHVLERAESPLLPLPLLSAEPPPPPPPTAIHTDIYFTPWIESSKAMQDGKVLIEGPFRPQNLLEDITKLRTLGRTNFEGRQEAINWLYREGWRHDETIAEERRPLQLNLILHQTAGALLHELTHRYHPVALGLRRFLAKELLPVVNYSILYDPFVNYTGLFYPALLPERMDPIVGQLSAYIGTLGDLNYLRKRLRRLMIVPCLLRNGMMVPELMVAEVLKDDWLDENEDEDEDEDEKDIKEARDRRKRFANPTPELRGAIAQTLYTLACCFEQYGDPGFTTLKVPGSETYVKIPKSTPYEEIWKSIWRDPEEMLTIVGLLPFTTKEGRCYVVIDRQNEGAWRGRDNRPTRLYHCWVDADFANRSTMKMLSKNPYPDVAKPPAELPVPPELQFFTDEIFTPLTELFPILEGEYPKLADPKRLF